MIHSAPKPLKVALEITKRLQADLAAQLTPEQRRDFSRVLKLIEEAERNHVIETTRLLHQRGAATPQAASADAPPKRRFLWA